MYPDDLIVVNSNEAERLYDLHMVLGVLRKHKLCVKLPNGKYVQAQLAFLGHIDGKDGLYVDPKKIAAM